jgi:hypothetical protein
MGMATISTMERMDIMNTQLTLFMKIKEVEWLLALLSVSSLFAASAVVSLRSIQIEIMKRKLMKNTLKKL